MKTLPGTKGREAIQADLAPRMREREELKEVQTVARGREPPKASLGGRRELEVVQGVATKFEPQGSLDKTVGVHFQKVLGGQTLTGNAANAKHLAKLEVASKIIGTIERFPGRLNSIASMKVADAFKLYRYLFPNKDEREETGVIKARLKTYDKGATASGEGFFAFGITDKKRNVIAYTQSSTVPSDRGVFGYWQYGGVADRKYMTKNYGEDLNPREHGILNAIHAMNAAVLTAAAQAAGKPALGMIWESEPRGLGDNSADIQFTAKRLDIHNKAGGRVMMGMTAEGELVNLHLQPSLGEGKDPITLHMMYRPLKYEEGDEMKRGELAKEDAQAMLLAWANNFRVEGFAEKDVAAAEKEMADRIARCAKVVLLPASDVPDVVTLAKTDPILERQVLDGYGVKDLEAARKFYDAAMTAT